MGKSNKKGKCMAKSNEKGEIKKKRKAVERDSESPQNPSSYDSPPVAMHKIKGNTRHIDNNPLLQDQTKFLTSLSPTVREHFFSNERIDADTRADVWTRQADLGEDLVNKYAWATPDRRALSILRHFAPIVEVGCGANAYWARLMHKAGVDVVAFDMAVEDGGKIDNDAAKKKKKKKKKKKRKLGDEDGNQSFKVQKGGPAVLSSDPIRKSGRALFLCYPDEDDFFTDTDSDSPLSMGATCLEHFQGDIVIHVGELHSDTPSFGQAPWGRSSSPEFQMRLAAEYHCILKATLPGWLHVRDTISVWKRSETCSMVFQGEDDSDEEMEYKYVPPEELLPADVAAPCVAHLLTK